MEKEKRDYYLTKIVCLLLICAYVILAIDAKAQTTRIADELVGTWEEYNEGVIVNALIIKNDEIIWNRKDGYNMGEETLKYGQYKLSDSNKIVKFSSRVVYGKAVFKPDSDGSGPVEVTVKREGNNILLVIGEMKVEGSGFIITRPAEKHLYKKVK